MGKNNNNSKYTMEIKIIGISHNIRNIKEIINQVADTELNILVCGETGVGKDLIVHNLYQKSNRVGKPFVKVNCAALPDTLLESEMFGYERGAFTGANNRMRGKFEQACSGVLFLDEIGDMSTALQSKLLHALQDQDFTPLGSERLVKTDVWVIAATNHVLEDDLRKGNFRADLYHRLNTIKINIEPLRNRPEDIPVLIDHYTKLYSAQFKDRTLPTLRKNTYDKLLAYRWPGNVRELQNVMKRILIIRDSQDIIDDMLQQTYSPPSGSEKQPTRNKTFPFLNDLGLVGDNQPNLNHYSLKDIRRESRDLIEKEVISYVLGKTGWNRTKASKILDISYRALLTKIKDLKIKQEADFFNLVS